MNHERDFNERCYELLKLIPEGKVTTYKELVQPRLSQNEIKYVNLMTEQCQQIQNTEST